jgi:hypothetical protein
VLRIFSPEKFDGFGRVWTRELGYQVPSTRPPKPLFYLSLGYLKPLYQILWPSMCGASCNYAHLLKKFVKNYVSDRIKTTRLNFLKCVSKITQTFRQWTRCQVVCTALVQRYIMLRTGYQFVNKLLVNKDLLY